MAGREIAFGRMLKVDRKGTMATNVSFAETEDAWLPGNIVEYYVGVQERLPPLGLSCEHNQTLFRLKIAFGIYRPVPLSYL